MIAENGTTKTYVINAARAQDPNYVPSSNNYLASIATSYGTLSPTFDKNVTHYAMNVPYECTSIAFTAAPEDPLSTCVVLGDSSLIAGTDNLFYGVVTAENGTTRIYYITVRRAQDYNEFISEAYTADIINQLSKQTDPVVIDMSKSPVQIISSKILSTLKEYPNMKLIINTINGKFTITGSDLTGDITEGLYDFTINNSSQYHDQMISDAANGINYIFSTHYVGEFPGTVEYTIYTNFTTGTNVNVYQYDTTNAKYITVAKNVSVQGGAVSFRYNQGGDFIITTDTIASASNSSFVSDQSLYKNDVSYTMLFAAAALFLVIGFGAGMIFARISKKPRPPKAPKTPKTPKDPTPPDDSTQEELPNEEQTQSGNAPEESPSISDVSASSEQTATTEEDNPAAISDKQMKDALNASMMALGVEPEVQKSKPQSGAEKMEAILDNMLKNNKKIDS